VIDPTGVTLEEGFSYDVIAVGKVGNIEPLILADDGKRIDANKARLRVAHLSPAASGPVDVYLTAAGVPLPSEASFSFSFKDSVGPIEVTPGAKQIRITLAGSDAVVYDSGEVTLPAGADLLVGAVDNTGANGDASPVSLLVLNGADATNYYDVNQQSGVRVVHNSADAPNVDVLINGGAPAITGLAFSDVAPSRNLDSYALIPEGTQNIKVTPEGDNGNVLIDANLGFEAGTGYTVLAIGLAADIEALVLADTVRGIATQASLRVVHGSTVAGPVDIYLLPEGETSTANATPALDNVPFGAESGYLAITPGTYNLVVEDASGNSAIGPIEVYLNAGGIYTVVARDNAALDGADLILLDNLPVS
jgi:hypothetical protein